MLRRERDLGWLDAQFLQHFCYFVIDVFAAVVRVKAVDLKRELRNHHLQHQQQESLAEALHAGLGLPLAHRVYAGDVINPFDAVQIALMHAVDADPARTPIGPGRLAHANRVAHAACFGEVGPLRPVAARLAQVVQVRDRQRG